MPSFAERIIAAHQAGLQARQAKEQQAQQAEDRKLQQQILKHNIDRLKITDLLEARKAAAETAGLLQGTPGQVVPDSSPEGGTKILPHPPITIPGIPDWNVPDATVQPQTAQEILQQIRLKQIQDAQAKASEPFTLNPGDKRFSGADVIAENPKAAAEPPALIQELKQFAPEFDTLDAAGKLKALADFTAARTQQPGSKLLTPEEEAQQLRLRAAGRSGNGATTLSPYSESNIVNRLTQRWDTQSKVAVELNRQVALMDAGMTAARRGDLAQGSQAVLVTFQKILDPTSVVRESEYARSAAGQALLARIQGAYDRLAKGGTGVPLAELEKYATLANEMAIKSNSHLGVVKSQIESTAERYKIPKELVTTEDLTGPKAPSGPKIGAEEGGYIFMGGNPADSKNWKKKK